MSILETLIENPFIRAQVSAQGRHIVTYLGGALGGAVAAGLLHFGVDGGTAAAVAASVGGIVISLGMWALSAWLANKDVKNVDLKINKAVALAPNSPPETIAALKAGKF